MEAIVVLDKANREIKVNDYIVYGTLLGRSAALKFGKVVSIEELKEESSNYNSNCRIRVLGVEEEFSWKVNKWRLTNGTLSFSNRTVVIPGEILPKDIKDLLDEN